jgi:hypothetical protein
MGIGDRNHIATKHARDAILLWMLVRAIYMDDEHDTTNIHRNKLQQKSYNNPRNHGHETY